MNGWQIRARSLARRLGVIRIVNRMRPKVTLENYETRIQQVLQEAIRPGDVVWDVGAYVGWYTELFSDWVGEGGWVVAFEPFPRACERLRERLADCTWVAVEQVCMGDVEGTACLVLGRNTVENYLADRSEVTADSGSSMVVKMITGDGFRASSARTPNVIKVDVEGFEQEVLAGLEETLGSPELRCVLLEVHFLRLEQRGRRDAPLGMEKMLKNKGFRTRWVDASHLFATR